MRRLLPLLLVVACAVGCSGGERPTTDAAPSTSVAPSAPLPAAVRDVVAQVAEPGTLAFRATYHVVRKLGGGETDVTVVAEPPRWTITAGEVVVRARRGRGVDETRLAALGISSRFFATAPARALATDARREGAGEPVTSMRTVAGVDLRCIAVPIDGATPSTYCLTSDGVFGSVDTPAVRYELTSYSSPATAAPSTPSATPEM
jgi:hypothetical protein